MSRLNADGARRAGLGTAIRLSYFAWLPTVASVGIGIVNLITGNPVYFALSTLIGFVAALGWAVWLNVDR